MSQTASKQLPLRVALWVLYDVLWIVVASAIYGLGLLAGGGLVLAVHAKLGWMAAAFAVLPGYVLTLLVVVLLMACVRLLIPAPQPGIHRKFSKGNFFSLVWLTGLNNVLFAMPFIRSVNFIGFLRFLYYRGQGMQTHFGNWISVDAQIVDPYMVRLGRNVNIGGAAAITGHLALHDAMVILPVTIGDNVVIGACCKIAPGVEIGDNALIGADSGLGLKVKVGEGAYLEPFSRVEANTVIGAYEKWGGTPAVKVGTRPRPKPPVAPVQESPADVSAG